MNNRPPNFPSHDALEDMGEDRNRRRRPNSPWGPIIVFVIILAVIVVLVTRHQHTFPNIDGPSNTTVETHAPELNIQQPLLPGTLTKVSGWVPADTGVEIQIAGPTGGSGTTLATQRNGYFSGTILVPDNVPAGGTVTVTAMVGKKTLINDRVKVTNPYFAENSVELHLFH